MSTYYARSIPCPGAEFGLEPCEERLTQRAVQHPDGFMQPGDWIEEEEIEPPCGCDTRLQPTDVSKFWDRVWVLLDAEEWKLDDD